MEGDGAPRSTGWRAEDALGPHPSMPGALALPCLQDAGGKPGWEIWGCLGPCGMELAPWDEHGLGCGYLDDLSRGKGVNEPFICFSLIKK